MPLGQGAPQGVPWGQFGQLGAPFLIGIHAGAAGAGAENAGAEELATAPEEAHGGGSVGGGKKKKREWRRVPFLDEPSIEVRIGINASEVTLLSQVPRSRGTTALVSLGTRAHTKGAQLPSRADMVACMSGNLGSCARILDRIVAPIVHEDDEKKKRKIDAYNNIRSFINSASVNLRGWSRLNLQLAIAHAYLREISDGIKFMALVNRAENIAYSYGLNWTATPRDKPYTTPYKFIILE
jgi:hypothetical protein